MNKICTMILLELGLETELSAELGFVAKLNIAKITPLNIV